MMPNSPEHYEVIDSTEIARKGYTDLMVYTSETRVYPNLVDGMKSVQRRIFYSSRNVKSLVKSVNIIGESIKIHPHGDASIASSLVGMASEFYTKLPLYDTQGNWGGLGESASAPRYIECCLSTLGRRVIGEDLLEYAEYVESDSGGLEPKYLPTYLSYALLEGSSGMGTGMPNPNIPSLNAVELTEYYLKTLKGEVTKLPTIDVGDVIIHVNDPSDVDHVLINGGAIHYKAIINQEGEYRLTVEGLTPGTNPDNLTKSIGWYVDNDVVDFSDTSTTTWSFSYEIIDPSRITMKELKSLVTRMFARRVTYTLLFVKDGVVREVSVPEVVSENLKYLKECTVRKYSDLLVKSQKKLEVLEAIDWLRSSKYITKLSTMSTEEVIDTIVLEGKFSEVSAKSVMSRSISYLTKSHEGERESVLLDIENYEMYKTDPSTYLIPQYESLLLDVRTVVGNRPVSVVAKDPDSISYMSAGKVVGDNFSVTKYGRSKDVKWSTFTYVFDSSALAKKSFLSSREDTVYTPEMLGVDLLTGVTSDQDEYIFIVEDKKYFVVRRTKDLVEGRQLYSPTEGTTNLEVFGSSSPVDFKISDGGTVTIDPSRVYKRSRSQTTRIHSGSLEYISFTRR